MALTVAHPFVSAIPDGADATLVRPSNWNANHTVSGTLELNSIAAATGAVTIASGNNTGIVWNWANTTNTTICHELGETTAATNGTSTSGVPNQVLLRVGTVAASTMSPLSVYSRAAHVFSVSPSAAQILATSGSSSAPSYSFASHATTGMYNNSGQAELMASGTRSVVATNTQVQIIAGTAATPGLTDIANSTAGIFILSTAVGISVSGVENSRFPAGQWQASKGTADAVSYAMNFRKARGTVASPTVITTGDDLLTISGFGYVGATNTYQEACRITFDSTGVIADTTTGIGGLMRFLVATVGAEPAEVITVSGSAVTVAALLVTQGYTVAALPAGVTGAIAHVTDQLTTVAAKGVAPTGGGAVNCVVYYNGAAWVGI